MTAGAGKASPPGADAAPAVFRVEDRAVALGLAVAYLMNLPSFAKQPFGRWSGVLTGAVNRGHYAFIRENGKVAGFGCWGLASAAEAEAWAAGAAEPPGAGREGEVIVISAWAAASPAANRLLLRAMRREGGDRAVYASREYPDGRIRPVRLSAMPRSKR